MNDFETRLECVRQAVMRGAHDVIAEAEAIYRYVTEGTMPEKADVNPVAPQVGAAAVNPGPGMDREALQRARDWAHPTDTIVALPPSTEPPVDQVLHPDGTDPTFVSDAGAVDTKYYTDTAGSMVNDTDKPAFGNGAPGAPNVVTEPPVVADPDVDPAEPKADVTDHGK